MPQAPDISISYTKMRHFYENTCKSSKINIKEKVFFSSSSVVRRVRRRRRPPSVRPSRPSVAVVRRRRPPSVRPSVPSVRRRPSSSPTCKSKAACKFSKTVQNRGPTASGLLNSESTKKCCRFLGSKLKKLSGMYVS